MLQNVKTGGGGGGVGGVDAAGAPPPEGSLPASLPSLPLGPPVTKPATALAVIPTTIDQN